MFKHNLLPTLTLEEVFTKSGKLYKTPVGLLPSVTNVIGKTEDKTYLNRWRAKIGDKAADAISNQAKSHGNAIHKICEQYMMNNDDWKKAPFIKRDVFNSIKPFLDHNIETVLGCELQLWSMDLNTAGTTDLLAECRAGDRATVDYKTSRREVKKDSAKLLTYKLQVTTYAMMVEERYELDIPYSVILVIRNPEEPQVFAFKNAQYRDRVREIFYRNSTRSKVDAFFQGGDSKAADNARMHHGPSQEVL